MAEILSEQPNGIVLKNPTGETNTYGDYKKIKLTKANGEKYIYSEGEAISKTVEELDFSKGNMEVPISDRELISELTICRPSSLIPENIAKDIEIAGIVGTHDGESGSKSSETVNFYDYDGTLIASYSVENISTLTALPNVPEHDGLIFNRWNYTLESIQNATSQLNVGAVYDTEDGKTRLYIDNRWSKSTAITLFYTQTVSGGVSIDWGDGYVGTASGTGDVSATHTYSAIGAYCITIEVDDGCVLGLGQGTRTTRLLYSNTYDLQYAFIGKGVVLNNYALEYNYAMRHVVLPSDLTSVGNYTFTNCQGLEIAIVPNGVSIIQKNFAYQCTSLQVVSIPTSVSVFDEKAFYSCYSLKRINIPYGVVSIGTYVFYSCYGLKNMWIPSTVGLIGSYAFSSDYGLENVVIEDDSVMTISTSAFASCRNLKSIKLPKNITEISTNLFQNCSSLKSIEIPEGVTTISGNSFASCCGLNQIILPSTLTSTNTSTFSYCYGLRIYAPDNKVETYKTLMSNYANIIFPKSEMPTNN